MGAVSESGATGFQGPSANLFRDLEKSSDSRLEFSCDNGHQEITSVDDQDTLCQVRGRMFFALLVSSCGGASCHMNFWGTGTWFADLSLSSQFWEPCDNSLRNRKRATVPFPIALSK